MNGRVVPVLALLAALAACGDDSPTQPSSPAPTMTCPANVAVTAPNGQPMVVTYPPPTVTGGTAPVTTTCAPASGTVFPIGASPVQCSTADGQGRGASCSFTVTVSQPPSVSATRYLAFGDSITVGENGQAGSPPTGLYQPLWIVAEPYPAGFNRLRRDRYSAQTVTVFNRGLGGETTTAGLARLPSELSGYQPQVLLLLEGANDLNNSGAAGVDSAEAALRTMARDAKSRLGAANVFVATLTPMVQGRPKADGYAFVPLLNERIKELPGRERVSVVDNYAALLPQAATLISDDGLHPNQAGYDKMAETFFATLRAKYEAAPVAAPSGLTHTPLLLERPGQAGLAGRPGDVPPGRWRGLASSRRLDPELDR